MSNNISIVTEIKFQNWRKLIQWIWKSLDFKIAINCSVKKACVANFIADKPNDQKEIETNSIIKNLWAIIIIIVNLSLTLFYSLLKP